MRSGIEACLAYPRIHVECERTIPCPLKDYQESQASPRKTAKRPIACAFVPFFFLQASPCGQGFVRNQGPFVSERPQGATVRRAAMGLLWDLNLPALAGRTDTRSPQQAREAPTV